MRLYFAIVLILLLISSCKIYKPYLPENFSGDLNKEEVWALLNTLESKDKIEIETNSGIILRLIYRSHTKDSLYANYNLPRNGFPTVIPLNGIQELKVSKTNIPLTLALSGLLIGILIFIASNLTFSFSGFSI
jgi:hypothetical protein